MIPQLLRNKDEIIRFPLLAPHRVGSCVVFLKGIKRFEVSNRIHSISFHLRLSYFFTGQIYIIGGWNNQGVEVAGVDRVNFDNGYITTVTSMSRPRSMFSAVTYGNHILVFGGKEKLSSCEEYDYVTDTCVFHHRLTFTLFFSYLSYYITLIIVTVGRRYQICQLEGTLVVLSTFLLLVTL